MGSKTNILIDVVSEASCIEGTCYIDNTSSIN